MVRYVRRHLSLKLFLSYLAMIVVGVAVLATTAELAVPSAFDRHMAAMSDMMGGMSRMLELDFFQSFRNAVTEALFVAAVVLSALVSRCVVLPVQEIQAASGGSPPVTTKSAWGCRVEAIWRTWTSSGSSRWSLTRWQRSSSRSRRCAAT